MITPSDFGVFLTNLPQKEEADTVKAFLEENVEDVEISYVNYAYKIEDIVRESRKEMKLQNMKMFVQTYTEDRLQTIMQKEDKTLAEINAEERDDLGPPPYRKYFCCKKVKHPTIEQIDDGLEKTKVKIDELESHLKVDSGTDMYFGTAFVVFKYQYDMVKVVDHFESSLVWRILMFILVKIFRIKWKQANVGTTYFKGNRIFAERAPEPTDVFWENLSVTATERAWRITLTYVRTFVVLIICFGINIGIAYIKAALERKANELKGQGGADTLYWIVRILTIVAGLFTAAINIFLARIIRKFSAHEKHKTYSKYNLSVAFKLTISLFFNTGIIPLLANVSINNWFDQAGLVNDVMVKTICVGFLSPLFYAMSPTSCLNWCRMKTQKAKGSKSSLTQMDGNKLSEGPNLDMAQ